MKIAALSLVVAAFAPACSSAGKTTPSDKPAPETVERACAHRIELGFWQGFAKSLAAKGLEVDEAMRAEGQKGFEALMAGDDGKDALAKCVDGHGRLATQAQLDCIVAAKTVDEADACN